VFAARHGPFSKAGRFAPMPGDADELARTLRERRNDLTGAAIGLVPEIATMLVRLAGLPGALITRMSGSGATCYALFSDRDAAAKAGASLAADEPGWWCAAGGLVAERCLSG
jgi:4-diphosphocytidyl-2-C-methyl-D-erythritol kinase